MAFGLWPAAAATAHCRRAAAVQTKWLISKGEREEMGKAGGGGNDSFMAAEKEERERDGEWQKKESD